MTSEAGTIHADVSQGQDGFDTDDGVGAFLKSFEDDPKRKAEGPSEDVEEAPEKAETETAAEPETEDGETEGTSEDPEDQEFEVKVNGESRKATLRELKRLYGQEAALTQRSQKLAEVQRETEVLQTRAGAALKAMLDKANERNAQYSQWGPADWAQLAVHMTPEDYKALKDDANRAGADVKFLQEELDGHIKGQRETEMKARHEQAVGCIKQLQDPASPFHIEGFDKAPYEEMMSFAEKHGLPEARNIIHPAGIKLLSMAMQWARHQEAAKTAEKKVEKVRENPKRVIKPGTARDDSKDKLKDAMKRMRGGDDDATVDAFMASF
jgi:hypothetical protein